MKIAICVPTRGLLFTKTAEAIERLRHETDIETNIFYSINSPIPEGHNEVTEKALRDGADYLLFVEEDVVPPAGTIEKLLAVQDDIACIDYGVSGWGCVARDKKNKILWCGLGCTLIKRKVFEALPKPYFRTDKVLRQNDWTWQTLPKEYQEKKNYGGLDIWFCCQATQKGFSITEVVLEEPEHLQLIELGQKGTNHGLHFITAKEKITKRQIIDRR